MAQYASSTFLRGPVGGVAEVDATRLRVKPKTDFQHAVEDGRAYSWASLDKVPDAGDTIFALENNSTGHLLCIQTIIISSEVAGGSVCPVFTCSGKTIAGTTSVDGVNLNRASGQSCVPISMAYTDETGQGEAAASWPRRMYMPQVLTDVPYIIHVDGAIRLPYGHIIGVDVIENAGHVNVTFIGWFEPI